MYTDQQLCGFDKPARLIMKKRIVGNTVQFTFDDGVEAYTFDCAKLSEANRTYAVPFAMCHRLGDAAALPKAQKDGTVIKITEEMRRAAVVELGDWYAQGGSDWEMRGGARAPAQNPVILAIAAKRGCTYAEAEKFLAEQFLDGMSA
jgi:hypothetical protein